MTEIASTTISLFGLEGARHAVELIFDEVFDKYIYKSKKMAIIENLLKKIESVDREVLEKLKYFENPPLKLYYLIFAVLKGLGRKINFIAYNEIIQNKTGYLLKRKTAGDAKKIYEHFLREKSVKEECSESEESSN